MPQSTLTKLRRLAGIELAPVGHVERLISGIGGFIAIYLIFLLQQDVIGEVGAAIMVASMGASAVLLFAVPHGALSQPWAVVIGHVASAVIGVACGKVVGNTMLAAALAVGLAIAAMHYLRAIHPPGGATALTAVIGGPQVHALGFAFVITPVLLNALTILVVAVLVNAFFHWRRYPAALGRRALTEQEEATATGDSITHADFVAALESIGTFVDISEDEFIKLRGLMREAAEARHVRADQIKLGAYYSNGAFGADWSVRRVIDAAPAGKGGEAGDIIWRVVAGKDRNASGVSSPQELASWAAYEVVRSESTWIQALSPDASGPGQAVAAPAPEPPTRS
ncbi:MAG: HPP family protein [Hyphomicrobiaceae bacterium]|nr:HPP family protein [Hyphomicrobiaceae bacterium]